MPHITKSEFERISSNGISDHLNSNLHQERKLNGLHLDNTIGHYLNCSPKLPANNEEWQQFNEGQFPLYEGESKKQINQIVKAIGVIENEAISLRIWPLYVFYEKQVVRIYLFQIGNGQGRFFVDNFGKIYENVEKWRENRELPPGILAYVRNFEAEEKFTRIRTEDLYTMLKWLISMRVLDTTLLVVSISAIIVSALVPGVAMICYIIGVVCSFISEFTLKYPVKITYLNMFIY